MAPARNCRSIYYTHTRAHAAVTRATSGRAVSNVEAYTIFFFFFFSPERLFIVIPLKTIIRILWTHDDDTIIQYRYGRQWNNNNIII
jgi:hypothetical protein